jgi:hypothetical protein
MADNTFKFNLRTWLFGDSKETWIKASGRLVQIIIVGLLLVVFISGGYAIWRFFNPKLASNTNKQIQVALPFSGVKEQKSTNSQTVVMPTKNKHIGVWAGLDNNKDDGFRGMIGVIGWLDF